MSLAEKLTVAKAFIRAYMENVYDFSEKMPDGRSLRKTAEYEQGVLLALCGDQMNRSWLENSTSVAASRGTKGWMEAMEIIITGQTHLSLKVPK